MPRGMKELVQVATHLEYDFVLDKLFVFVWWGLELEALARIIGVLKRRAIARAMTLLKTTTTTLVIETSDC